MIWMEHQIENKKNLTFDSALELYKAGKKFQRQANTTIPCIIAYSHRWGRHWIAALVHKQAGKVEVLLADSWRRREDYNLAAVEILLDWLHDPETMWQNYRQTVFSMENKDWQETLKSYRAKGVIIKAGPAFGRDEQRNFAPLQMTLFKNLISQLLQN